MHHPFQATEPARARVTAVPGRLRRKGRNAWTEANRGGLEIECSLEAPCFDRDGMLRVVEIPAHQ